MARLRHAKIEAKDKKCCTEVDNPKANGFISKLSHKMRVGLISGLALIGAAVGPIGCARSQPYYDNCKTQQPTADAGVIAQRSCAINRNIPISIRGGGMLMFGSTILVDQNGAPLAKVVLGSKSTPCDALAAAYIAEAIAMSTFKSKTLSSQVAGTATCSTTTGASCSVDMSGVYSVIMPNNAPNVVAVEPYSGTVGALVILDADAIGVNTLISVGNTADNSVTAQLLAGSSVDWNSTQWIVTEVVQGAKIVVAGAQPPDTLSAAEEFVAQLKKIQ